MTWRDQAACRGRSSAFVTEDRQLAEVAIRLCNGCPVRGDCTAAALDLLEAGVALIGVWGGVWVGSGRGRVAARATLASALTSPTEVP